MNLGLIGNIAKKCIAFGIENSTTILKVCAIGGTVGTAVATGHAVIEARDIIKAHEMDDELRVETMTRPTPNSEYDISVYYRERTAIEKAKLTWKCFVLPVFLGGSTIGCIIGMDHISTKRNLALAAAYSMSEEAAKEFRDKVADSMGEKKVQKIENEIVQDHIKNSEVTDVIHTPYGEQLMYDDWSGRYFRSGQNDVEKRVNMLNKRMTRKNLDCVTVNDFYELVGLPTLEIGEKFGWIMDYMHDDPDISVSFHPTMSDQGEACIGVKIRPVYLEA